MQPFGVRRRFALHLPQLAGRMRLFGLIGGCAIAAAGITMTLHARLGVGPYDVLISGTAAQLGITFGMANVLTSSIACLLGWRLGARVGPGTLVAVVCIGPMIDGWRWLLPEPSVLALQVVWLLGGLVVLAFGLALVIAAQLGPGAIELVMLGIAARGVPLRWARTGLEVGMCVVGILLGGQFGVGTFVCALLIGHLIAAFVPREIAKPAPR